MPKRVPFRVIYSSGGDEGYSAKELEVQSPYSKGWRSPRYCPYPQEIIVRIDPPGQIRKIQLLSHQYLIATKVELYVGEYIGDNYTSTSHTRFTRLGYISLSDNEAKGFRSMELKSINVDCVGQLLKLILHQNHINQLNLYNQVSLVALNIIADPIPVEKNIDESSPNRRSGTDYQLAGLLHSYLPGINDPGAINKPVGISPLDDLAFYIAQDPETADLVRRLERRKASAIRDENYQEAKRIKLVIDELCKAGEILCRYEVEKKEAIAREDYDTAKIKKDKLDAARMLIYEQLNIHGFHLGVHSGHSRQSGELYTSSFGPHESKPRVRRTGPFDAIDNEMLKRTNDERGVLPPIRGSLSPPPGMGKIISDERPLPALVGKSIGGLSGLEEASQREANERSGRPREELEEGDNDEPSRTDPLTERQINEVSLAIEIFGMEMLEKLYAKQYSVRENSISEILGELRAKEGGLNKREINNIMKATCQILVKGFRDKVLSVFSLSQDLLKYLIGPFAQRHSLSNQDYTFIMEKVGPVLLLRTGDLSPRILDASLDSLTKLMRHPQIQELSLFGPMLIEPFKKNPSWRLIRGRIVLLEKLLDQPGLASSGLSVKKIMQFTAPYLNHGNNQVRDVAIRLTMVLYRSNGGDVKALMPVPDDATSRKKTLWRTIFEGFDKIDGKPTRAEREAMNKASQDAKRVEISKMKEQLQTLKSLVANTGSTLPVPGGAGDQRDHRDPSATTSTTTTTNPGPGNEEGDTLDRLCVFCGKQQEGPHSDLAMETHYLEDCPMLQSCLHCHQVIEISGLTKHWLTECKAKDKFKECPHCKEAISRGVFESHVALGSCQSGGEMQGGASSSSNRCPLCHSNIPAGDESWQKHLMSKSNNPGTCPKRKRQQADTTIS